MPTLKIIQRCSLESQAIRESHPPKFTPYFLLFLSYGLTCFEIVHANLLVILDAFHLKLHVLRLPLFYGDHFQVSDVLKSEYN